MLISYSLLTLVYLASFAKEFVSVPATGFGGVFSAALLFIVSREVPGDASRRAKSAIRKAALPAALPLLLMIAQLLPVYGALHPIWDSSNSALGADYTAAVTADRGRTAIAIVSYLNYAAVFFAVAIIAASKKGCEGLVLLLAILASSAAVSIDLAQVIIPAMKPLAEAAPILASQGLLACLATAVSRFQHNDERSANAFKRSSLVVCGIFAVSNAAVIVLDAPLYLQIAVVVSLFVFAMAMLLRLLPLVMAAFVISVFLLCAAILAFLLFKGGTWPGIKLNLGSVSVQRMIMEQGPLGMGAGTFTALKSVYLQSEFSEEISALSIMLIEFGRMGTVLFVALWVALILALAIGCYRRQRDSHYSACGSAVLVLTFIIAVCAAQDIGPPAIFTTVIFAGIGLAQAERSVSTRPA